MTTRNEIEEAIQLMQEMVCVCLVVLLWVCVNFICLLGHWS